MATERIVSLVPSLTELLYDLGLSVEVAGITKFCIHPNEWFKTKPRVGGTKTVDLEKVKALHPTLIIANKEENVKEQVEALQQIAPVLITDVPNLEEALTMIEIIGKLVHRQEQAVCMAQSIRQSFIELEKMLANAYYPATRACYLIWKEPYMTVGSDTMIHDLMQRCGWLNIFGDQKRYPEISVEQIRNAGCDLLLLSSEPYHFQQQHIVALQQELPDTKIILANGEMFSWYGSRLQYAAVYFKTLIATTTA
ncbi:MAG TPA: helical backbone metal receptor [Sediminibacterium sp.]|nr:helical backbone metal receptor [Sediminibacterium sp.]